MQIPTQPPQRLTKRARGRIHAYVVMNPNYTFTPHDLIRDGIVERYDSAGGYFEDVATAAIDDLLSLGVLEEIGVRTYRRALLRPALLAALDQHRPRNDRRGGHPVG